jgi:hypothetical protein
VTETVTVEVLVVGEQVAPLPLQPPPLQELIALPDAGVAVSVTLVVIVKDETQLE